MENNDLEFINPDKIKNPQVRRVSRVQLDETENEVSNTPIETKHQFSNDYANLAGTVKIDFESGGRFGNPETLILRDYSAKQINDLITTKEEDLFETLLSILNECVIEPKGFDIGELTTEELFEVMLGMKLAFDSPILKHRWLHNSDDCQGKLQEDDKKISETDIDLTSIKMTSIEESDEKIKEFYKSRFDELSDEQFKEYLLTKYGVDKTSTKEEELKNIKIQEPFLIRGYDEDYEFGLIRSKDLLLANKMASKEINYKLRVVKNQVVKKGINPDIAKEDKEEALNKLNVEKARKILTYAQALSLRAVRKNGETIKLNSPSEKIEKYINMPRPVVFNYVKAVESIVYGVNHEEELVCNLCGGTERGFLQRILSPIALLPIPDNTRDSSSRNIRQRAGFDFYF